MKILLAMSGGIDSSVVAHMLQEQGHEVIGVRFTLWTDPLAPALAQILPSKCCTTQNIARAHSVAKELSIPLHVIDLEREFKESVVDPYLEAHRQGLTPNPCIGCNRTIKFGKLLELMRTLGCDKLATGHYARVASEKLSDGSERYLLLEAIDSEKDQSYYLYGLTQDQLKHVFFPLGGMKKSEVYTLALHFGVPLPSSYRESQDLCFFPEKTPTEFLKRHLSGDLKPGNIVRRDGTVVGKHKGLPLYTYGQRRGLGIGGLTIPLEVIRKDVDRSELVVDDKGRSLTDSVTLTDVRFISEESQVVENLVCSYRPRSLSPKKTGRLVRQGEQYLFQFDSAVSPQSPGQSIVFYRGEEVLGGGVIEGDKALIQES
ncbi:MAG: tRNA 2-thiouridine(34) synthase MnmA [Candidatus Peribacteraceae bacterium]